MARVLLWAKRLGLPISEKGQFSVKRAVIYFLYWNFCIPGFWFCYRVPHHTNTGDAGALWLTAQGPYHGKQLGALATHLLVYSMRHINSPFQEFEQPNVNCNCSQLSISSKFWKARKKSPQTADTSLILFQFVLPTCLSGPPPLSPTEPGSGCCISYCFTLVPPLFSTYPHPSPLEFLSS